MLGWLTVGTIVLLAGAVVQLVTRVAICLALAIASRGSKRQRGLVGVLVAQSVRGDLHAHHDRVDLDHVSGDRQADRPLARVEAQVGDREDLTDLDGARNV